MAILLLDMDMYTSCFDASATEKFAETVHAHKHLMRSVIIRSYSFELQSHFSRYYPQGNYDSRAMTIAGPLQS